MYYLYGNACGKIIHLWEYMKYAYVMYVQNYMYIHTYTACEQMWFGFVLKLGNRIDHLQLADFAYGGQFTKNQKEVRTNFQVAQILYTPLGLGAISNRKI